MLGLVGDVEAPADGGAGGGGPRREVVPQHVLPAPCQGKCSVRSTGSLLTLNAFQKTGKASKFSIPEVEML